MLKDEPDPVDYQGGRKAFPGQFVRLCVFAFLVTFVTTMIRGNVVEVSMLDTVIYSNNIQMLIRIIIGLILIYLAVFAATSTFNFGRLYTQLAFWIAVVVVVAGIVGGNGAVASIMVTAADNVIEITIWCLLAFIVYQRKLSPPHVFGVGRGFYSLGTTLGWAVGAYLMPRLESYISFTYIALGCAFVVMVAAVFVFAERNFNELFKSHSVEEESLEDLVGIEVSQPFPVVPEDAQGKGRFKLAVSELASEYSLSPREKDVFLYLAMGHGGDYIAEKLCVSWNTVRTHTHHVYVKLGVHSREELMSIVSARRKELE